MAIWLATKATKAVDRRVHRDASTEHLLVRLFVHPERALGDIRRALGSFLAHAFAALRPLVTLAVIGAIAWCVQRLRRRHSLTAGARLIRILPPPEIDPARARVLWGSLQDHHRPWWRRLVSGQPHFGFEMVGAQEDLEIAMWVPKSIAPDRVERAIQNAFPGALTPPAQRDALKAFASTKDVVVSCELRLSEGHWLPLAPSPDEDPLGLAVAWLSGLGEGEAAVVQVLARPALRSARRHTRQAALKLRASAARNASGYPGRSGSQRRGRADPSVEGDVRAIVDKGVGPLWHCTLRVAVSAPSRKQARGRMDALAGSFGLFEGRNAFRRRMDWGRARRRLPRRLLVRPFLLSTTELAQIATLPGAAAVPGLERAGARTAAPPKALTRQGRVLGVSDHPGLARPVALAVPDCRRHVHIIGSTGTGKTNLLAQLVLQDAAAGRAAVVIDPWGDLVTRILQRLPDEALDRTCVIDPEDSRYAVGLNLLAGDDIDLVVDHVVGVFKRIYEPWWGPRTDDIMRAACLTLAQIPGATLAEIPLLLANFEWRRAIRDRLNDVVGLGSFWAWYEKLPEQQRAQHIAPLLNKLRAFLLRGPVRAIVGQSEPKQQVESLLDSGGLLLVRVPKGTLGEDTSRLLGAFVIARVWQACMKRSALEEEDRADAALYVDETHNYLALPKSFEDLLAEARGYRLSLFLAHQHMGQLPKDMREALGANARTKIAFACSPEDATQLERHFLPTIRDHDLSHLAAYQAACRPCIDGGHGSAFTLRTQPLGPGSEERAELVRARSAIAFAHDRAGVERAIARRQTSAEQLLLPPMRARDRKHPSAHSADQSADQSAARSPLPDPLGDENAAQVGR